MTTRKLLFAVLLWWLAVSGMSTSAFGKGGDQLFGYTFSRGTNVVVTVYLSKSAAGVEGQVLVIQLLGGTSRRIPLRISPPQFDKLATAFAASGAEQFPIEQVRDAIDLNYYYMFIVGNQKYAVAKKKPTPAVATLANRMQSFAPDKMLGLPNGGKGTQPSSNERVIVH